MRERDARTPRGRERLKEREEVQREKQDDWKRELMLSSASGSDPLVCPSVPSTIGMHSLTVPELGWQKLFGLY